MRRALLFLVCLVFAVAVGVTFADPFGSADLSGVTTTLSDQQTGQPGQLRPRPGTGREP